MSASIDELIEAREKMRESTHRLTQEIKVKRKAISLGKKKPPPPSKQLEANKALRAENARLRGMIALLKKADNSTYRQVAELLGVSCNRARVVIDSAKRDLRWEAQKET